jgi:hypothetical protein
MTKLTALQRADRQARGEARRAERDAEFARQSQELWDAVDLQEFRMRILQWVKSRTFGQETKRTNH